MQAAVQAVIEKQFGPDDGHWMDWSRAKRRAYGGVYRYLLISSTRHQDDLRTRSSYMRRALQVDPSLATDLDLFYDLAMCAQPMGQRGTAEDLNLADSAHQMAALLSFVFESADTSDLLPLNRRMKGTANFALGLLAYNTHQFATSRRFLAQALRYRPDLWQDPRLGSNLLKSLAGARAVSALRRYRR